MTPRDDKQLLYQYFLSPQRAREAVETEEWMDEVLPDSAFGRIVKHLLLPQYLAGKGLAQVNENRKSLYRGIQEAYYPVLSGRDIAPSWGRAPEVMGMGDAPTESYSRALGFEPGSLGGEVVEELADPVAMALNALPVQAGSKAVATGTRAAISSRPGRWALEKAKDLGESAERVGRRAYSEALAHYQDKSNMLRDSLQKLYRWWYGGYKKQRGGKNLRFWLELAKREVPLTIFTGYTLSQLYDNAEELRPIIDQSKVTTDEGREAVKQLKKITGYISSDDYNSISGFANLITRLASIAGKLRHNWIFPLVSTDKTTEDVSLRKLKEFVTKSTSSSEPAINEALEEKVRSLLQQSVPSWASKETAQKVLPEQTKKTTERLKQHIGDVWFPELAKRISLETPLKDLMFYDKEVAVPEYWKPLMNEYIKRHKQEEITDWINRLFAAEREKVSQ